jgi:hypothetical protein
MENGRGDSSYRTEEQGYCREDRLLAIKFCSNNGFMLLADKKKIFRRGVKYASQRFMQQWMLTGGLLIMLSISFRQRV